MFTTQRLLFFMIFGFVAIMFAIRSKQLDNLIYKEIQDYDNLQDEMFKVARKQIRSQNRVRKMLERTTAEKTERAEKEKQRLEKDIKNNYELERELEEKDRVGTAQKAPRRSREGQAKNKNWNRYDLPPNRGYREANYSSRD